MGRKYKTKFPVARIKKIMRTDEDVGKVTQATPVMISKALELFLQSLVDATSKFALDRGDKKITPSHIKKIVQINEQFDFLSDIVESIPDLSDVLEGGAGGIGLSDM